MWFIRSKWNNDYGDVSLSWISLFHQIQGLASKKHSLSVKTNFYQIVEPQQVSKKAFEPMFINLPAY